MNILRKITLFLVSMGLLFLLFFTAAVWTLRQTVMDRAIVKSWLDKSGVYDGFVDQLAKIAEEQTAKQAESAPENEEFDPAVFVSAAKKAFPPNVLQENVEAVLNGAYDWLEGDTDKLTFTLDLTQEKQAFIDALGNEALTKAATLPTCPAGTNFEDFDPFQASCIPSGTDITAQITNLKNELAQNPDFFGDPVVTQDDVKVDETASSSATNNGDKTPAEAFKDAPKWYGYAKLSPLVVSGLALLNILLIWVLSRPLRKALKTVGVLFITAGTGLLFTGLLSSTVVNWLSGGNLKIGGDTTGMAESIVLPLTREVNSSFSRWNFVFGGAYLTLGILLIVLWLLIKKPKTTVENSNIASTSATTTSKFEAKPLNAVKSKNPTPPSAVKGVPEVKNK